VLASRDRTGPSGPRRGGFTTREQVDGLSLENIDRLFTDGRKSVVDEFVPVDIEGRRSQVGPEQAAVEGVVGTLSRDRCCGRRTVLRV
jgi:hypothetical protein